MTAPRPSLRVEKALLRGGAPAVFCVDEVGRGALAGPVSVGVVVVDASVSRPLSGVADSKLLSRSAREALVPRIRRWVPAAAVGHASPAEVDEVGVTAALRLAAHRAFAVIGASVDVVLLDGNVDWVSPPAQVSLLDAAPLEVPVGTVHTRVKADLSCAGVAAASVLAKVDRDAAMCALAEEFPEFGWESNKGYASPTHVAALERLGPSSEHRRSWSLPGVSSR